MANQEHCREESFEINFEGLSGKTFCPTGSLQERTKGKFKDVFSLS